MNEARAIDLADRIVSIMKDKRKKADTFLVETLPTARIPAFGITLEGLSSKPPWKTLMDRLADNGYQLVTVKLNAVRGRADLTEILVGVQKHG